MAITTINNRAINRADTAASGESWTATSATASDFQAGGNNTPAFAAYQSSGQSIDSDTTTIVTLDTEIFDTDSAFASNTFTVPAGEDTVIDEYKNIHKPNAPKGIKVDLQQGDMLIYSGCELEHWRKPFTGDFCVQVFLHYNHANGKFGNNNLFDKRPMLGIPKL